MTHLLQHCDEPALDAIYKRELHERVVSLLMRSTISIEEFLVGTEGAYMLDVIEALRCGQENENALVASSAGRMLQAVLDSSSGPQISDIGMASVVPEPHPLDFDWRFVEPRSVLSKLRSARTHIKELASSAPRHYSSS